MDFYSPEQLIDWKEKNQNYNNILYLCDFEFMGSKINGIKLINQLQINYLSILVTNLITHEVTSSCEAYGIRLLSKANSNTVRISN